MLSVRLHAQINQAPLGVMLQPLYRSIACGGEARRGGQGCRNGVPVPARASS